MSDFDRLNARNVAVRHGQGDELLSCEALEEQVTVHDHQMLENLLHGEHALEELIQRHHC